ncbi:esterase-like activity of phytase family protein [Sphingomonas sp. MMSM24]|uniref:Esterase-like activity of phytase family protein n=1 Tax=Sphingomonas lycopersici TaxID=2951807 RepID=A0AA41ZC50_9SPHN|nr:esterase-like activity of phytase family protein [Sphingomonas lycopersici]MCW6536622.1 esterase-like activity of phytase family protein [Sphingomonas lycopersici]
MRPLLFPILAVLAVVPGWSGIDPVTRLAPGAVVRVVRYVPEGGWPARIGRLEPVGAVTLSSAAPGFGGFSALAIERGRATLLGDSGNWLRLRIARGAAAAETGALGDGPGSGWSKEDRDSESLAIEPASGRAWVGFERANAIWRYDAAFRHGEAHRAPHEMAKWWDNSGAESLARLPDGRFVVIAERWRGALRPALLFAGDPASRATPVARFFYRPPAGYDPSDAAALPSGDLLVLNRRHLGWLRFSAKLVLVPRAAIRAGGVASGREIATLAAPVVSENCEGLAVSRENGATMLWITTDNDQMAFRRSYLMKFRLR